MVDAFCLKHCFFSAIHHKKSDKDVCLPNTWSPLVLLGDGSEVLVNLRLVQGLELGVVLGHNSHLKHGEWHEEMGVTRSLGGFNLNLAGFEVCR